MVVSSYFGQNSIIGPRSSILTTYMLSLVSGSKPSQELAIYQRLNEPQARKDPRNHTLPVIDYLAFNELTFVVVPRSVKLHLHHLWPDQL
jgi:hypothetical protein